MLHVSRGIRLADFPWFQYFSWRLLKLRKCIKKTILTRFGFNFFDSILDSIFDAQVILVEVIGFCLINLALKSFRTSSLSCNQKLEKRWHDDECASINFHFSLFFPHPFSTIFGLIFLVNCMLFFSVSFLLFPSCRITFFYNIGFSVCFFWTLI